jgi:hypothetical protein
MNNLELIEEAIKIAEAAHEKNLRMSMAANKGLGSKLVDRSALTGADEAARQKEVLDRMTTARVKPGVQKAPEVRVGASPNATPIHGATPAASGGDMSAKVTNHLKNAGNWVKANPGKAGLIGAGGLYLGHRLLSRKNQNQY